MTQHEKLGRHLRRVREALGLSPEQAAEKARIGRGEVILTEQGKGAGTATLRALARAYRLDYVDLLIRAGHLTRGDIQRHQERVAA